MAWNSIVLMAALLVLGSPIALSCPDSCFCMDAFVVCTDFHNLNLGMLPPYIDTLVLSKGEMEEIPPYFVPMAKNLNFLEMTSISVRIVRGGAFRGLSNLEMLSITNSTFDIVEPDSFSDMSNIKKIFISECKFGRVAKHAFADIEKVEEIRIWSSSFETISDEAFRRMDSISSFQMFQNNITYMGSAVFLDSANIHYSTVYLNRINKVMEGSLESLATASSKLVLYANKFVCSCDFAWILQKSAISEYLHSNECVFQDKDQTAELALRISDLTLDALCPVDVSTEMIEHTEEMVEHTEKPDNIDIHVTEQTSDLTVDLLSTTVHYLSTPIIDSTSFALQTESSAKDISSFLSSTPPSTTDYLSSETDNENLHLQFSSSPSSALPSSTSPPIFSKPSTKVDTSSFPSLPLSSTTVEASSDTSSLIEMYTDSSDMEVPKVMSTPDVNYESEEANTDIITEDDETTISIETTAFSVTDRTPEVAEETVSEQIDEVPMSREETTASHTEEASMSTEETVYNDIDEAPMDRERAAHSQTNKEPESEDENSSEEINIRGRPYSLATEDSDSGSCFIKGHAFLVFIISLTGCAFIISSFT